MTAVFPPFCIGEGKKGQATRAPPETTVIEKKNRAGIRTYNNLERGRAQDDSGVVGRGSPNARVR